MFGKLLALEWKSFFRSASMGKDLAVKILLGFFAFYGLVSLFLFGVGMHFALKKLFPNQDPIYLINQYVLIWFIMELIVRYMMQKIPVLHIKPFLIQNIKRKTLVNFILTKSIFSYFNTLTPVMIIPFAVVTVMETELGPFQLLGWTLAILSMVLVANFLNMFVEKKIIDSKKLLIPFLAIIAILYGLEHFEIFSSLKFVAEMFNQILVQPFWCLIPLALAVVLYKLNQKNLLENFYLDAYLKMQSESFDDADMSWTQRFGKVAPFMQLDMKLIWRNKRPKTVLYMSLFFALYGLFFYSQDTYNESATWAFIGLFMTGIFMMNFGQFIPAWDSTYYPMMMTQNIPMKLYLHSKMSLMNFSIVVMTLLTLPYGFFDYKIILLNIACAIYNFGINVPLLLYAGSFNKKRVDLDKDQFANYQGTGVTQWLIILPLIGLPVLVWAIIKYFGNFYLATFVLAILGVLGFLGRNYIFQIILQGYKLRKYTAISGFKQQNA